MRLHSDRRSFCSLHLPKVFALKSLRTNLYYTTARFDTALSGKTTSDLTEGTNLYYTDTRVNADIDARVTTNFVDNLNVDAATLGGDSKTTILADAEANALALSIALG